MKIRKHLESEAQHKDQHHVIQKKVRKGSLAPRAVISETLLAKVTATRKATFRVTRNKVGLLLG